MRSNYLSIILVSAALIAGNTSLSAQDVEVESETVEEEGKKKKEKKEKKESDKITKTDKHTKIVKYRRGSLHTMIIEDEKLPKKDIILNTFENAEFPEKYNNHTVGDKSFKIAEYQEDAPEGEGDKKKDKDISPQISKYLEESKLANKMMAKWFNRSAEGAFDMSLIQDRGAYDASAQDAATAVSTERGLDMLKDAGIELIGNTFVVVNHSKFVSNEAAAKITYDIAVAGFSKMGKLGEPLIEGAKAAYEKARQGYSIWTTAYLYQMVWNDSTEAVFYMDMWMDSNSVDPAKKEIFDNSNLFQFKYLGYQKASALITGMGANAENEEMIIKNATLKSINAVYNKLQRKFEAFRTKTPLVSTDPIAAKIGLKEGIEPGDKYEVLEQQYDADGRVTYKRKGVIKVDKKNIWDNRFNAGEEGELPLDENGEPIKVESALEYTQFKGSGKSFYPGMLIRQIN